MSEREGEFSRQRFESMKADGWPFEIDENDWAFLMDYIDYLHIEKEEADKAVERFKVAMDNLSVNRI